MTRKEQLGDEVEKILAHAKTKDTMGPGDDAVADRLIELLRMEGHISPKEDACIEWQGAWEHDVAAIFYGDDHCLNVDIDGNVTVYN